MPVAGGVLVVAGLVLLAVQLTASGDSVAALMPALGVVGLGNGLLLPPLMGAALTRVRPAQAGAASGTLTTAQQFAGALGVTLLGMLFFATAGPGLGSAAHGMRTVAYVYAGLAVASVALLAAARRA